MIRDGIKTLAKQGVCPEKLWPYVISRYAVKPSAACYSNAATHMITSYERLLGFRRHARVPRRRISVRLRFYRV